MSKNLIKKIKLISNISRINKIRIVILNDLLIGIFLSLIFTFFLKEYQYQLFFSMISLFFVSSFYFLDFYSNQLKFLSNKVLIQILYLFIFATLPLFFIHSFFAVNIPYTFSLIYLSMYFIAIVISRLVAQSIVYKKAVKLKNVIIYGAGVSGNKLYKSIAVNNPEYNVVAFLDDDESKKNEKIDSIRIYSPSQLKHLKRKYDCYAIFIAMPGVSSEKRKSVLLKMLNEDILIKIVPSVKSIVEEKSNLSNIENIKIQDIIGRKSVNPIQVLLEKNIKNSVVLISGAGGSIGSELVNQVLKLNPNKVIALDMSEFSLFQLQSSFKNNPLVEFILCNINDRNFVENIISKFKPDIIFHAAAYKHVSIVEDNILNGVMNNVNSTYVLASLSAKYKVNQFVLVSTDKAVNPSNFMGRSKMIAEVIVNQIFKSSESKLSIVRFGNVLNSSGSVLKIFETQLKNGGPLTVTDKNVTRYFMSIPEAAQLIIQSSAIDSKDNTFILEMGEAYNIYDLAKKIIQINGFKLKESKRAEGIEIKLIGLQPGEKLHEELITAENTLNSTIHPKINSTSLLHKNLDTEKLLAELTISYEKGDEKRFKKAVLDFTA